MELALICAQQVIVLFLLIGVGTFWLSKRVS